MPMRAAQEMVAIIGEPLGCDIRRVVRDLLSHNKYPFRGPNFITLIKRLSKGVETVGEWKWLAERDADYLQGFLFARPAAPPERAKAPA